MYIIIKPIKQEENVICVEIAQADFYTPFYRRVFETEQEIYVCGSILSVKYWLQYISKFMTREQILEFVPAHFEIFSFEFDYSDKSVRIIKCK